MKYQIDQNKTINLDTEQNRKAGITTARNILISGGIIAFPTESFYGLAVNAMDEKAVRNLFTIKKRDLDRPILILIPSVNSLERYVSEVPDIASELIGNFWPGGLTIVFKANKRVPALLTSGSNKIGLRLSSHPIATGLAKSIDSAITGTSANLSGQSPCVNAEQIFKSLGDKVDLILDNGVTAGGKGSTVLDITTNPACILREGMIGREELEKYI